MSVESREKEDQAAQLKKLFQEVDSTHQQQDTEVNTPAKEASHREIDVLNLPPRKEVHGQNGSRAKLKLNAPFVRFVSVMIIIIGLLIGAYFIWGDELIQIINNY